MKIFSIIMGTFVSIGILGMIIITAYVQGTRDGYKYPPTPARIIYIDTCSHPAIILKDTVDGKDLHNQAVKQNTEERSREQKTLQEPTRVH